MSARTLERIKLGLNPNTGEVFLYRHGANPGVMIEGRSAMQEMFMCFIGHMMFGLEEGQSGRAHNIKLGNTWYRVIAAQIDDPTVKPPEEVPPAISTTEIPAHVEVPQDQELPQAH